MNKLINSVLVIPLLIGRTQAQVIPAAAGPPAVYQFTKGLVALVGSRYGREAIYTDPLAYQLYTNTLKQPTEGALFSAGRASQSPGN